MRIRFNVGLEPEFYDSHSYAIKCLRLWQQEEKARNDESEVVLQRRIQFHRDLYLSGLFLHELAPQLPAMLTQTLLQDRVNCQTLASQLSAAGLSLQPAGENGLSDKQWQKLTAMLEEASVSAQQAAAVDLTEVEQQLSQLQQQMLEGQAQLNSVLANATENLVTQTQAAASATPAQDSQQAEFSAQLEQLKQGQDKLMAQMKSLSSQLAQVSVGALANNSAANDNSADTPSLETQLERARRVKSKGLW
ncbi:hypothetical protein [Shewanella halifaxensis]|uniref:hypothetical protein n=1 Tax=Shewanella halifaxensis TaxID=271098 RepID=UPI000D590BFE|nr:hypothetical protein [Shewanella halifaxensis]